MKKIIIIVFAVLFLSNSHGQTKAFTVKVTGKGSPIILIPGYSCSGDVWNETVAHLQNRFECHVLTIAGYAGTATIDTPILKTVRDEIIKYTQMEHTPVLHPAKHCYGHLHAGDFYRQATAKCYHHYCCVYCLDALCLFLFRKKKYEKRR